MRVSVILLLLLMSALAGDSQQAFSLPQQLRQIAADAHGQVAMACALPNASPAIVECNLNPAAHPPMQSVFKLPLALTIFHQIEQGQLTLDQQVHFRPDDCILPVTHSPLQDEYPQADVDVPVRKLLQLTVVSSDNAAADLLLRTAGGPRVVTSYIASLGVAGFHLQDNEHALHRDVALQYRNWFAPQGAVHLLRLMSERSPLTAEHTALLLDWMRAAIRSTRIQGDLPPGTVVAHRAGTSGVDHGLAHATNDIGLITLPDGRQLALAIFLTDSTADDITRDKVIARLSRAVYDAAVRH